jgi:hypothetical protein
VLLLLVMRMKALYNISFGKLNSFKLILVTSPSITFLVMALQSRPGSSSSGVIIVPFTYDACSEAVSFGLVILDHAFVDCVFVATCVLRQGKLD